MRSSSAALTAEDTSVEDVVDMTRLWGLGTVCVLAGIILMGCAEENQARGGPGQLRSFADDYDAAMDERRHDLPNEARTVSDIKLIARANRLATACSPGRGSPYSREWFEANRDHEIRTARGRRTVDEMAEDCRRMLKKIEHRPIEACGARYVQLERHLSDDDSWSTPRVTRSEGWYMTPCDKTPGVPALREMKEAEEVLRNACDDPKASYYLISRWTEDPGGKGMVATVACILPKQERTTWLPGNPALGVK
jgi:hypothetical protein